MDLTGRAAIITGASQGLGKAIAAGYVRAGASVLLVARGADLLRQAQEEVSALGHVKLRDVEAAQYRIIDAVRKLEAEGDRSATNSSR